MTSFLGKKRCGFTLLECAVAAGLFSLLVAGLLGRVGLYHEEAERVAAKQLIGTLRAALQVRAVQARGTHGEPGLGRLLQENPMGWLSEKPNNYLGEYFAPELEQLPAGNWLFDRAEHSLIYLLGSHKSFSSETSKFLKFKVKFIALSQPSTAAGLIKVSESVAIDQVTDQVGVNTN